MNLSARIGDYNQPAYKRDKINLPIVRAINGISGLNLIERELVYYHLMIADSRLILWHSEESKQKMSLTKIGFKHMSETGSGASWYGKQLSPTTKQKQN